MSIEENLISKSSLTEKNRELKRDLDAAMEKMKNYEELIAELKALNASNMKKFTHDLASPLQILLMSIESLEDRTPEEFLPALERMKRSADNMLAIITTMRRLNSATSVQKADIKVV